MANAHTEPPSSDFPDINSPRNHDHHNDYPHERSDVEEKSNAVPKELAELLAQSDKYGNQPSRTLNTEEKSRHDSNNMHATTHHSGQRPIHNHQENVQGHAKTTTQKQQKNKKPSRPPRFFKFFCCFSQSAIAPPKNVQPPVELESVSSKIEAPVGHHETHLHVHVPPVTIDITPKSDRNEFHERKEENTDLWDGKMGIDGKDSTEEGNQNKMGSTDSSVSDGVHDNGDGDDNDNDNYEVDKQNEYKQGNNAITKEETVHQNENKVEKETEEQDPRVNANINSPRRANSFFDEPEVVPEQKFLLPSQLEQDKGKKCLVLDLDETLVHSTFQAMTDPDYVIPVVLQSRTHHIYVYKRPSVDEFIEKIGEYFEVVVFTASLNQYADPLLDLLDRKGVIRSRLFRESCVFHDGVYVKDLSLLNRDLSQTIIVDNSPVSYMFHPENAIGCSSFIDDMEDRELDAMFQFLLEIKDVDDVREHCPRWTEWVANYKG